MRAPEAADNRALLADDVFVKRLQSGVHVAMLDQTLLDWRRLAAYLLDSRGFQHLVSGKDKWGRDKWGRQK